MKPIISMLLLLLSLSGFAQSGPLPQSVLSFIETNAGTYTGKFAHSETFANGFPLLWERRKNVTEGDITLTLVDDMPVLEFKAKDGSSDLFNGECKSTIGKFIRYKKVSANQYDLIFNFDLGTCDPRYVGKEITLFMNKSYLGVEIFSQTRWETTGGGEREHTRPVKYYWLGKFIR